MIKRILILASLLVAVGFAIIAFFFRGEDTTVVDQTVVELVKEFDNHIYITGDRTAAIKAAETIIEIADRSSDPNETKARGYIRLGFANIAMGKWDSKWKEKVAKCEALISEKQTIAWAEYLLYSGSLRGKWGKHEFEVGLKQAQEARAIAHHLKDDRTLALSYIISTEMQMFLRRSDLVAMNAYRAVLVADHYGESSIKCIALRNLLMNMLYLDKYSEASCVAEMLLEDFPQSGDALYANFLAGKSTKIVDYVQRRIEQFESETPDKALGRDYRMERARIGKLVARLGRGYLVRGEFSKCREAIEWAMPHLKAVNDQTNIQTSLATLNIAKLEFATDVATVDRLVAEFEGAGESLAFVDAVAAAYDNLSADEKSLEWKKRAFAIRTRSHSEDISYLRRSAELYWESELGLRKETKKNEELAEASRRRDLLLTIGFVVGLAVCSLLAGFYYLLRQKSNSLEAMVQARTKSLSKAMQKANAADLAKSDFLAQINHEIRNPLTAILGYCDLLSTRNNHPEEFIAGIESSSLHLRELVDKILEVSKIESNGLEMQPVDFFLMQTVKDIRGIMADQMTKQGLKFECNFIGNSERLIRADETKIRQIALNLIGNANKFTEQGSVTATFELTEADATAQARLVIEVTDTGIGIEENQSENVFERFTKASNAEAMEGSGLGLYITKQLAECMGGEIALKSSLRNGTQVTVTLPVQIADVSAELPKPANLAKVHVSNQPLGRSAKRVLIVDDQEMIRKTLTMQLEVHGLECKSAWELESTIHLVENWQPDLVLLDLRMPDYSGFKMFEEIRTLTSNGVPVYALTGDATVRTQQKCLSVGFDGFITKPFKIDSILEILHLSNESVGEKV